MLVAMKMNLNGCWCTCTECGYQTGNVISEPTPDTPCPRCRAKGESESPDLEQEFQFRLTH